jgi:hypothetical protein
MKYTQANPLQLTHRFDDAVAYATIIHAGQLRKGTGVPYIAHLLGVTSIALEHGADEDEAIGALLHDAGEDAGGLDRIADIRGRFGDKVAMIVGGCTDAVVIPKPPWRERKAKYIAHLASAAAWTLLVSASDKLHNARAILRDVRRDGDAAFERFNGKKEGTLWYYRSLVTAFRQHRASNTELIDELDRVVAEIEKLSRQTDPAGPAATAEPIQGKTVRFGDIDVPVIRRDWVTAPRMPYRKTYSLKPGQSWKDAPQTPYQWEAYVVFPDGEVAPVGAVIARELIEEGASSAVFTEMWGGLVLVGPDLVCVTHDNEIGTIVKQLREACNGKLAGLPDVIAVFPDGRIAMREAKNISSKDRLGPKQHGFVRVARNLFGEKLDLAVVEWGSKVGKSAASPGS